MTALRWATLAAIPLLGCACSNLADEATRRYCAAKALPQQHNAYSRCILESNGTILIAKRHHHEYVERFNQAAAEPILRAEYQRLRKQASSTGTAEQRQAALQQLGTLNQWLERHEGLDLHPWKDNPADIQRVVAKRPG